MKTIALLTVPLMAGSFAFAKSQSLSNKETAIKIDKNFIKIEHDKIEDNTWYYDKKFNFEAPSEAFIKYAVGHNTLVDFLTTREKNNALLKYSSGMYIYIGQVGEKSKQPFLHLVISYAAVDWLFVQKYKIVVDGTKHEQVADPDKIIRKARDRGITERVDIPVAKDQIRLLEMISSSKETIIRFYGKDAHEDHTVSKAEKTAIKHILDLYKQLSGAGGFL